MHFKYVEMSWFISSREALQIVSSSFCAFCNFTEVFFLTGLIKVDFEIPNLYNVIPWQRIALDEKKNP